MTMIDGQLWQRCVQCENLVPASARNYFGVCLECAPPVVPDAEPEPEEIEIAAADVGELQEET